MKPATVNRELDTLNSILSKAVEWKYLVDSPARGVKRFRVQNRRTRILSADEQSRLLDACERMPKLQALLKLALITGARVGELLALRWEDCQDCYLTFWDTKNGKVRRIPITENPDTHPRACSSATLIRRSSDASQRWTRSTCPQNVHKTR